MTTQDTTHLPGNRLPSMCASPARCTDVSHVVRCPRCGGSGKVPRGPAGAPTVCPVCVGVGQLPAVEVARWLLEGKL
jgi:hypothetical protein